MARKKAVVEEPEPDEVEQASDESMASDVSEDEFEPEDFEAGSEDFVDDSEDVDVVAVDDDEEVPLDDLPSDADEPDDDDDDAPLLLTKDEEFEDYDEDDESEVEGLREGEFVCSSCSMVFRLTALADPKAMLCRDCV